MAYSATSPARKRFDLAGVLVYVLIVCICLAVWLITGMINDPNADQLADQAAQNAILYAQTGDGSVILEGIDPSYRGAGIEIPSEIDGLWVYRIESDFLKGSDVRHVLMDELPNSVADDAFSGTDGLVIYADNSRIVMESWAQGIEIRPEAEFENVPKVEIKHVDRKANLMLLWKSPWFVIGVAAAFLTGLWLLGKLRVSQGFEDPYKIPNHNKNKMKMGFFKKLYIIGTTLAAIIGFLLVFGENFDYYADYSQMMVTVNGYAKTYGIPVVGGMLALVLIRDLFRKDLLWLLPRLVIRVSLSALFVGLGAGIGMILADMGNHMLLARGVIIMISIAIPTLAIASVIAPLMVLTGIDKIGSGQTTTLEEGEKPRPSRRSYQSITVRAPDGSLIAVRQYSHGAYVGDDEIVAVDSRTVTGASGTVYTKQ